MAGELRTACRATRDAGAGVAFGQREDGFESQVPSRSAEAKRAGWPPVGMKSTRLARGDASATRMGDQARQDARMGECAPRGADPRVEPDSDHRYLVASGMCHFIAG